MAGARVVEEILKRAPDRFDIVMFGAEPYGNYNRILLSNVLNGSQTATDIFMNPLSWYRDNGITLHAGVKATRIDRERRVVVGHAAEERRPGVQRRRGRPMTAPRSSRSPTTTSSSPPARGRSCRRWKASADPARFCSAPSTTARRIADYARASRRAAVIGGGLLGLEAARGLLTHGVEVTVLEAAPQLMMAQLDPEPATCSARPSKAWASRCCATPSPPGSSATDGRITHLEFKDGSTPGDRHGRRQRRHSADHRNRHGLRPDGEQGHRLRRPDAHQRPGDLRASASASSIAARSTAWSIRSGNRRTCWRTCITGHESGRRVSRLEARHQAEGHGRRTGLDGRDQAARRRTTKWSSIASRRAASTRS